MSATLWYGIIQYFVGIIIVLALLFALMESSRKYDRYREWPYLALASGYFLLVVWSLLRALSLNSGVLHGITIGSELIGFLFLGVGYLALEHAHPFIEEEPASSDKEDNKPKKVSTEATNKPNWITMLSAETKQTENSNLNETDEQIEISPIAEIGNGSIEKSSEAKPAITKKERSTKKTTDVAAVDLSYLAQKVKKKSDPTPPIDAAVLDSSDQNNDGEPGVKNETTPKEYIKSRKNVVRPSKSKIPEEESREELLDDLFPIKTHPESEPLVANNSTPSKKKVTKKVTAKKTKQILPAGILVSGLNTQNLLTVWPQATIALVLMFIILELVPQREAKGNKILIAGFIVLLLATLCHVLFDANAATLPNLDEPTGIFQLAALVLEVIGFSCIGASSWQKIKGKVTHHFLLIISVLYGLLLVLTVGLANLIVHDGSGLQLLTLLMTGVLITLLPIVHALAYNHPHHQEHHD